MNTGETLGDGLLVVFGFKRTTWKFQPYAMPVTHNQGSMMLPEFITGCVFWRRKKMNCRWTQHNVHKRQQWCQNGLFQSRNEQPLCNVCRQNVTSCQHKDPMDDAVMMLEKSIGRSGTAVTKYTFSWQRLSKEHSRPLGLCWKTKLKIVLHHLNWWLDHSRNLSDEWC